MVISEGSKLSDETDERNSHKDVILGHRLNKAIKHINPWISEDKFKSYYWNFTRVQFPNLIEANQSIWNTLTQYISVMQDIGKGNKGQTVKIIDFENIENNEFLCTNQFKVEGVNQNIIPDIILFVNGLPLAVIECKSPYITNPMESGIDQLMRYANRRNTQDNEGAEKLFHYNQFMVSTHRDKARVGTITSRIEHFLEWKDTGYPLKKTDLGDSSTSQDILIAGMFEKTNFLDLIQNFTVFEPMDGRTIKKIARYQQFRAVHKSIERIKSGTDRKSKSGVIWHTQGSGKSLTMVFLTLKIRRDPELRDYKMVFITDRTQLDTQLTATFQNTQSETIHHANSVKELKELLQTDSSDIITAMVQISKSADENEFLVLNDSSKIIVLADEAHRTQYGTLGAAINVGLPNAAKIALLAHLLLS